MSGMGKDVEKQQGLFRTLPSRSHDCAAAYYLLQLPLRFWAQGSCEKRATSGTPTGNILRTRARIPGKAGGQQIKRRTDRAKASPKLGLSTVEKAVGSS